MCFSMFWSTRRVRFVSVQRICSVISFWATHGFPCGHRCTVGIDRDPPMCLDDQGGIKAKRRAFVVGVVGTWSERCVVVNILPTVGTENTYTPARLEALFKSTQPSPFVPSRIRSPRFFASDCVLNPFQMFRVEICRVVLRELLEVRVAPLHCTGPVQPGRCSSRAVFHSKFLCPRNSPSCTSS